MHVILFDDVNRNQLLPITFTRPVANIRIGVTTIRDKWEFFLNTTTYSLTQSYLSEKYPLNVKERQLLINGAVLPNEDLIKEIKELKINEILISNDIIIAAHIQRETLSDIDFTSCTVFDLMNYTFSIITSKSIIRKINHLWQIFTLNDECIKEDFERITNGRTSAVISETNTIINKEKIFIEEGVEMQGCILNATHGPIYIGKNVTVMEGSMLRGSLAICENAVIKMGAKIYEGTTIGPWCKVGGEISNSVIIGYSNKGHDGYLGNSVLGEWCNLGADTNTSNLKNTYEPIKLYNYPKERFVQSGETFIGLIMGDHSKSGINSMFNSGTVVGVNANLFGEGFQRNFVPSFSWGGRSKMQIYNFEKAVQVAKTVCKRRKIEFNAIDEKILLEVFKQEKKHHNS